MLLRKQTYNNNNKAGTEIWHYEYSLNGGTWTAITATSVVIRAVAGEIAFADGNDCSNQLTTRSGVYVTDNNGYTTTGLGTTYSHTAAYYSETALVFYIPDTVDVDDADDIEIRIVEAADTIDYNSITANITVIKGGDQTIPISDAGSGSDATPGIAASTPVSDTGSGISLPAILASVPVTEAGSGSDAIALPTISIPIADTGSSTDVISLPTINIPITDVGSGLDSIGLYKKDILVATQRVAASTSPGTQDITSTILNGKTPKAAILMISTAISDGAAAAHCLLSLGFADGTSQFCVGVSSKDAVTTSEMYRHISSSALIRTNDFAGSPAIDGVAVFSSFISNGIRINWTDAPPSAYFITAILFAGEDLLAYVGTQDLPASTNEINITAPNFEPSLVFTGFSGDLSSIPSDGAGHSEICVGFANNDAPATVTQRSVALNWVNSVGTMEVYLIPSETYSVMDISSSGIVAGATISNFDSDGFSITPNNTAFAGKDFGYLALNFGLQKSWVGTHMSPTATGNNAKSGLGFKPQSLIMLGTMRESL